MFGLEEKSAWKNVKDTCGGDPLRCTNAPAAYSQQSKARQQASISTAAFIAGGASAALGALIYFAHLESRDRRNAAFALTPNIGSEKVGVFVEGSF